MKFVKMHGLGNDFLLADCLERVNDRGEVPEWLTGERVRQLCDRHRGVGADGVLCVLPSRYADVRMLIFNADGSRAKMCGNGIRCIGKYLADHEKIKNTTLYVETDAGVRQLMLYKGADRVKTVRVDMGTPDFVLEHIPVRFFEPKSGADICITRKGGMTELAAGEQIYPFVCVSVGNPHGVLWLGSREELENFDLEFYGRFAEQSDYFPEGINIEAACMETQERICARVWERGCGETSACGTGACAVACAAMRMRKCATSVLVKLPGGELQVYYDTRNRHLYLTGPAEEVFTGNLSECV